MTKMKPNTLLKRTTLAVMLTSALLSGCSENQWKAIWQMQGTTPLLNRRRHC